jgi:hypothetical protein
MNVDFDGIITSVVFGAFHKYIYTYIYGYFTMANPILSLDKYPSQPTNIMRRGRHHL